MERRVILAAGHLARTGATSHGRVEGAETIAIVNRTAAKLREDGRLKVVLVPHALDLREQIAWVNARFPKREDGYAAEVHKNAGGGTGVEGWFLRDNAEAKRKIEIVVRRLAAVSRHKNRGVFPDNKNHHGRLGWCVFTKPWNGLFECGFIDRDPQVNDVYAEGLFRGFLDLFGLSDQVQDLYRVVRSDGRQVGAFRVRSNAWSAFKQINMQGEIRNRNGADVTAEFVREFGSGPHAMPKSGEAEPGFRDDAEEEYPPVAGADDTELPEGDELGDRVHDDPVDTDEPPELADEEEDYEVEELEPEPVQVR